MARLFVQGGFDYLQGGVLWPCAWKFSLAQVTFSLV